MDNNKLKTYLTAIYCTIRCILFPGSKICVASSTRTQANEVLLKITDDLCKNYGWGSSNLNGEIEDAQVGQNKAMITFKNGSWIRVVTASDNGRGARANILIVDEFRMVDLDVINTVLRRFLTAPRHPGYLDLKEYANLTERNQEIYMSSCWYKSHWSFSKIKAYAQNFLKDDKKYFICALPYQISILENLLSREQVADEMSEADFDEVKFSMEMEALYYGDTNGSFFTYDDFSKQRKIKNSFLPLELYKDKDVPKLAIKEHRILSVDIALMSSRKNKNDASALILNSAIPMSETKLKSNIVYLENQEGLTTDELGILVMRYFYKYKCTDLVLDANGVGQGVYDFIIKDQYDPTTGETYGALTCINDDEMASRCKVKDAKKCVWSIKASASFNTEMSTMLRNGIKNGNINFLIPEYDAEEYLKTNVRGYNKMPLRERLLRKAPFVQTSLLANELINLNYEVKNNNIKISEKSGMRKDRYSSLGYNFWVVTQIERKLKPQEENSNLVEMLISNSRTARGKIGMFD